MLLEDSGISGVVDIELHPEGILIRNIDKPRSGWDDAFQQMSENEDDENIVGEAATRFEKKEWQW